MSERQDVPHDGSSEPHGRPALEAEWELVGAHYRDYADQLRRFVRRVAADRGLSESLVDTESVVHETLLSMVDSYDVILDPRAWLFTVARRLVGKIAARHQHRRADGDPHDLLHTGTARWSSLTPLASAEDIYAARQAVRAIASLPDHQKKAVYLRTVHGWTTAEISDYLQCAPATVSVHFHRGIHRLRDLHRLCDFGHAVPPGPGYGPPPGGGMKLGLPVILHLVVGGLGLINFVIGFAKIWDTDQASFEGYFSVGSTIPALFLLGGLFSLPAILPGDTKPGIAPAAFSVSAMLTVLFFTFSTDPDIGVGTILLLIFGNLQGIVAVLAYLLDAGILKLLRPSLYGAPDGMYPPSGQFPQQPPAGQVPPVWPSAGAAEVVGAAELVAADPERLARSAMFPLSTRPTQTSPEKPR